MLRIRKNVIEAYIESINDNNVVISVGNKTFKVGQNIVATTPSMRKTALGVEKHFSDIVTRGLVTKVQGNLITVESKIGKSSQLKRTNVAKIPVSLSEIK